MTTSSSYSSSPAKDKALVASKSLLHITTPDKPDAVLAFLRHHVGLSPRQLHAFGRRSRRRIAVGPPPPRRRRAATAGCRGLSPSLLTIEGTQHRGAVRGPSRGLVLEKYVHTHNEKPKVHIFRDHPVGTEASIVANEISLYMWNHFPWAAESFKHVAPRYRDALVSHIRDNIDFEDCTDEEVTDTILKMAANRYRDRRCRLHKYCNELQAKGIDPVTQPYRNWAGSSDDWRWLCEHFGSEAFQRRSEANKVNRSKIDSIHTQGSASFAQGMKRMGLSGVDAYAKFYQNKSGEFVIEEARQRHDKEIIIKDERYDENTENVVARLDKNVEIVVVLEMKRMSTMEDSDCAWMALNKPPTSPSVVATAVVSVVVGDCGSLLSILSFATLEQ
ncbi:uncharacterized protein [Elaeis guineensis]|uniref:uncharacterized protein n=1 Tax=Elaeis guineensis var. tenera TaxID=51953 RepID=UPI003C6D545B